ncbi:Transcriptional regulator STP2 [Candida viswanathii]|uniref:Transcriptional regulator STP2 n=1 Tax=Candida viswanathii TaxID=5486 RepID=A0A367YC30_9ASCO|nr:Transcriptional regulator STP2 [Candida viswanathii]
MSAIISREQQPPPQHLLMKNDSSFSLYTILRLAFEYLVTLLVTSLSSVMLVKEPTTKTKSTKDVEDTEQPSIFPSLQKSNFTGTHSPEKPVDEDVLKPTVCSTGITSRILPFTNDQGELEWKFTEMPGAELDAFKLQPDDHKRLTPTSSSEYILKQDSMTPGSLSGASESPTYSEVETPGSNNGQSYKCPHCDVEFKVRGYLTRHMKKHSTKKAYRCPFHDRSIYIDDNNITHKCHPSGGFSRRDTYKTHLKSRHFNYGKAIKSTERSNVPGLCAMCGEQFSSAEIWCEIHVEGGECKFLPAGFKGKSRIKNKLRKQIKKNKTIDPELMPFADKVREEVEQEEESKTTTKKNTKQPKLKEEGAQTVSPVPIPPSLQTLQQSMDTPASIYSSSSYESTSSHSPYTPQSSRSPVVQPYVVPQPSYFDEIANAHQNGETTTAVKEDYDDEFCLDVDQLSTTLYNEMVGNLIQHPIPTQQQQQQQQFQAPLY